MSINNISIRELDEFLDDERIITAKAKETYLNNNKRIKDNTKKAVGKNLDTYYHNFKWLRPKKGEPMKFKLGEPRQQIKNNDKRTNNNSLQMKQISQAYLHNFLVNKATQIYKSEQERLERIKSGEVVQEFEASNYHTQIDGYWVGTPKAFFVYSGLISKKFQQMNPYNDSDEEVDSFNKYYHKTINRSLRDELGRIKKEFKFESQMVTVHKKDSNGEIVRLCDLTDEQVKELGKLYNEFVIPSDANLKLIREKEVELSAKGYEKPNWNMNSKSSSMKEYQRQMTLFLKQELNVNNFFYAQKVELDSFLGADLIFVDAESVKFFRQRVKDLKDNQLLNKVFKNHLAYAVDNELKKIGYPEKAHEFNETRLNFVMKNLEVIDTNNKLDSDLGMGEMSQANLDKIEDFKSNLVSMINERVEAIISEDNQELDFDELEEMFDMAETVEVEKSVTEKIKSNVIPFPVKSEKWDQSAEDEEFDEDSIDDFASWNSFIAGVGDSFENEVLIIKNEKVVYNVDYIKRLFADKIKQNVEDLDDYANLKINQSLIAGKRWGVVAKAFKMADEDISNALNRTNCKKGGRYMTNIVFYHVNLWIDEVLAQNEEIKRVKSEGLGIPDHIFNDMDRNLKYVKRQSKSSRRKEILETLPKFAWEIENGRLDKEMDEMFG